MKRVTRKCAILTGNEIKSCLFYCTILWDSLWISLTLFCPRFFTLAISKCYGKVRVLFFRATTLVSARKSHSSGVRGLVVRCLLFNPEGSCSNPWVCAKFFVSIPKQKVLTFSALWDSSLFSALCTLMSPKGPPFSLFWYFVTERMLKNPKGSLLSDFLALWDY